MLLLLLRLQNIGLAIFPILVATIYNHATRYIPSVELLFVGLAALGFLNALALNVWDWRNGWVLNQSSMPLSSSVEPNERTSLLGSKQV